MAMSNSNLSSVETPLLDDTVNGCLDFKGRPVRRSNSGGWRSASFIIAVEVAEMFAYYGINANLITYLTGPLGQSTAAAAAQANAWSGTATLLPLLGAFVADSFLGRYLTLILASLVYIVGLGLMTLSAILTSSTQNADYVTSVPQFQLILFFFSLYLVAIAQGMHKPCLQAFGADQFDAEDPEESRSKSSFFNWWFFATAGGVLLTLFILIYIQDNISWVLGFALPGIVMVVALLVLVVGTMTYRFSVKRDEVNPFVRIARVFILAFRNRKTAYPAIEKEETLAAESSKQFIFLNKALLAPDGTMDQGKVCSIKEVEEAKTILRLAPIWATSLIYAIVFAQSTTLFTKQGATVDRSITKELEIPAATLQCFIGISIMLFIPIYDQVLVPLARLVTGTPSGITMLQRVGTGIALSAIAMVVAALVEMKRLQIVREHGLVDEPNVTVPMSVWWLVPQYVLYGLSDAFAIVGFQEFFYGQVPSELRSVGVAVFLSIIGVGSFLSSFIISVVQKLTSADGRDGWFPDNLNRAHLDYFYFLLAGLSAIGLALFVFSAKSYIYARVSTS